MKIRNIAVGLLGALVVSLFSSALTIKIMDSLQYPLSSTDKRIIGDVAKNEILPSAVADVNWNKYFYLFDWVIPPDPSALTGGTWHMLSGGGSWTYGGSDFTIKTSATAGYAMSLFRSPNYQTVFRWDRQQKFKTSFQLSSITNQTVYIVRGNYKNGNNPGTYFGFKVVNGSIYGVSALKGTESVAFLQTILASTIYDVQA